MAKRRVKRSVLYVGILVIAGIILIVNTINNMMYEKTYEYKFKKLGYSNEDVTYLLNSNDEILDYYLTLGYNESLVNLTKQKYYIDTNLEAYLDYINDTKSTDLKDVVSVVNVSANNDWYDKIEYSDLTKDTLVLVNKFNNLTEDFEPTDLVSIPLTYAYSNNYLREIASDAFVSMARSALDDDIKLIAQLSYRSYETQESAYNRYANESGVKYADDISARAGHSEHQTGLSLDIVTTEKVDFVDSEAFVWLTTNAHKYGFILRYPENSEHITGYNFEPWHYRYVGIDVATKIYNQGITFDEYYAYYLR